MDRLDSMRVFLRVAETGSFTKAADLLDMPRATVSAAVQQLEAQLGSRLHRTTRQVQLTHDGSVVLERCRHLLEDMEELESLFHDGSRASGRLKVDVPSRVARLLIAPAPGILPPASGHRTGTGFQRPFGGPGAGGRRLRPAGRPVGQQQPWWRDASARCN